MKKPRKSREEINRAQKLRRHFGITIAQYDAMYVEQGGACAICEQLCTTGRRLAVDHNHATDKVRGLLCSNCNQGLGRFKDSPELLHRAARYLTRKDQRTRK